MEIEYHGANCFKIGSKKSGVVIDDNLDELGGKPIAKAGDLAIFTLAHGNPKTDVSLVIDQPGEYEVSNVSIIGIAARAHIDEAQHTSATIYKLVVDDIKIAVLGHIYPELSDSQLEAIGTVDILLIPIGGNGYTLDSVGALKLIKKIEPKIIIPSSYADKQLKYPVPLQSLEEAVKGLAMEPRERLDKLKIKPADLINDGTQLIILEKQ